MNYTKVDELLAKAGCKFEFLHVYDYENFSHYQFAELIVRECMQVSMKAVEMDAEYEAWYLIKQHVGVSK